MTANETSEKPKDKPQKRLIIVHGWEGHSGEGWFPWLRAKMERRGWEVKVPTMPNSKEPKAHEWLPYLTQVAGKVDENTFMVGHSLGCVTIVKFLENLSEKDSIGGAVLVAGFDNPLKYKELDNFFNAPVNWEKAKNRCEKFVSIHSEDDPYVSADNSIKYKNSLGAEAIVVNGFRNFSGSDGITSLPVVFEKLLEISK